MSTYVILGKFVQTPDENKRYTINYTDWLDTGETVTAAAYEIDNVTTTPLAVTSLTASSPLVTFFVSGGMDTERYKVVIEITTSAGQVKQDAINFVIRDHTP